MIVLLIAAVVAAAAAAALVVTVAVVGVMMMMMMALVAAVVVAVAAMAAVVYPPMYLGLPDLSCELLVYYWGFALLVEAALLIILYLPILSTIYLANLAVVDYTQFPNVFL